MIKIILENERKTAQSRDDYETEIYRLLEHLGNDYILKLRSTHLDILRERRQRGEPEPDPMSLSDSSDGGSGREPFDLNRFNWLYLEYAPHGDLTKYIQDMRDKMHVFPRTEVPVLQLTCKKGFAFLSSSSGIFSTA